MSSRTDDPAERSSAPFSRAEADKLAHALVSRGLLTREEWQRFRKDEAAPAGSIEEFLERLVHAGLLTEGQARRLAPDLPALMQQHIPGYQLLEKLGQGSMGTVFKGRQLSVDRLVAIKFLQPKLAADRGFLDRFRREAHLAARFSSNNVVQAIDVGSAGNLHYFVMEYVEGTTIKEALEKGKIFTEREAVEIVLQIAQALEHAHRRGLVHRDVKPANIILTKEGIAKLADLGLARLSDDAAASKAEKGLTIGTPYYIAPEQVRNRGEVDSRADIYSLGATFYHMVTGQPPFPYKKVGEVLRAHVEEELTPPDHLNHDLSSGLGEVVEFMMAKKPADRYQSPEGVILDLECLLQGDPPKIARQKMHAQNLAALAEGEEDRGDSPQVPAWWLYAAAAVLALSLLGNLLLALR